MPGAALEFWWRRPFRFDECGNRLVAAICALQSPGAVLGVIASIHEVLTRATGYSVVEILFGYYVYLSAFGIMFGLLLGVPYVLLYDRFIGGPRLVFIAGATALSAIFGGLIYGWGWVFAVGAIIMSTTFVTLLRLPPPRADP